MISLRIKKKKNNKDIVAFIFALPNGCGLVCVTNKNICISAESFIIWVYGRIEASDDRDYMCELSLISRDLEHAIGHGGWVFFVIPRFRPPP